MLVLVKKDSATVIPIEVDDEKLRVLIQTHGAGSITKADGSPIEEPAAEVAAPKKHGKKGKR